MIRVLIADNSSADIDALIAALGTDPEIEVVGVAMTGMHAIRMASKLKPDIITISESLQNMDVFETVKQIMAYTPTPILILTDLHCKGQRELQHSVFKATSMGALDVIEKPVHLKNKVQALNPLRPPFDKGGEGGSELVETVKLLSRIKVVTHLAGKLENNKRSIKLSLTQSREKGIGNGIPVEGETPKKVIAIAASTGGPRALLEVLHRLPAELRAGIVIVQHVAEGFSSGLAEWLDKESKIKVREAQDGHQIRSGYALLAPTGFHMVVGSRDPSSGEGKLMLNKMPPVAGHRPSADILFASVAEHYGRDSIGVILTGMGADGAKGIVAIKNAGGKAIAQDEQSSTVFGMPKAAVQTGFVDEILPLASIADAIMRYCNLGS